MDIYKMILGMVFASYIGAVNLVALIGTNLPSPEVGPQVLADPFKIFLEIKKQTGMPHKVPHLEVSTENFMNAHAMDTKIVITERYLRFLKTEHQIAAVLAHEISHVMLGHHHHHAADISQIEKEMMADMLGTYLMTKAGYNPCQGALRWKNLSERYGDVADSASHPSNSFRYNVVRLPYCK